VKGTSPSKSISSKDVVAGQGGGAGTQLPEGVSDKSSAESTGAPGGDKPPDTSGAAPDSASEGSTGNLKFKNSNPDIISIQIFLFNSMRLFFSDRIIQVLIKNQWRSKFS